MSEEMQMRPRYVIKGWRGPFRVPPGLTRLYRFNVKSLTETELVGVAKTDESLVTQAPQANLSEFSPAATFVFAVPRGEVLVVFPARSDAASHPVLMYAREEASVHHCAAISRHFARELGLRGYGIGRRFGEIIVLRP